jgi:hypothetical protein
MTAWTGVARTERGRCRTLGEKGGPLRGKWRSLRIGCRAEAPGQRTVLASRIVSDLRCALMTTLIFRQRDSLAVAVPRRVTLATCIAGGGGTVPDIISGIINAWEYGEWGPGGDDKGLEIGVGSYWLGLDTTYIG